jgi:hypothetical protein
LRFRLRGRDFSSTPRRSRRIDALLSTGDATATTEFRCSGATCIRALNIAVASLRHFKCTCQTHYPGHRTKRPPFAIRRFQNYVASNIVNLIFDFLQCLRVSLELRKKKQVQGSLASAPVTGVWSAFEVSLCTLIKVGT